VYHSNTDHVDIQVSNVLYLNAHETHADAKHDASVLAAAAAAATDEGNVYDTIDDVSPEDSNTSAGRPERSSQSPTSSDNAYLHPLVSNDLYEKRSTPPSVSPTYQQLTLPPDETTTSPAPATSSFYESMSRPSQVNSSTPPDPDVSVYVDPTRSAAIGDTAELYSYEMKPASDDDNYNASRDANADESAV